jgi:membrane-associated protein
MFLVCYFGALLGDLFIYSVGRGLGPSITKKAWFRLRFGQNGLAQAKNSLEKRSILMIFIARHLFYLRTLTFLTCGAVRMNFWRFLIADAVAALISVPLMLGIGFLAAEHYDAIFDAIRKVKGISLFVVALLAAGGIWLYRKKVKEKRQARKQSKEQGK